MGNIYSNYKRLPNDEKQIVGLTQIMIEMFDDCGLCQKKNVNGYLIQSVIEDRKLFICDDCSGTVRN